MKIETPGNVDLLSMSKQYLMRSFEPFFYFYSHWKEIEQCFKKHIYR